MRMRDLTCAGRPAFPPTWLDPYTGAAPLHEDPLAGILVGVEWGRHNLSLELTNHWRGRRLTGRLVTDDVSLLPRVHTLLSASIPLHLDEIVELEIPASGLTPGSDSAAAGEAPTAPSKPGMAATAARETVSAFHPDVAALILALVGKGLLTHEEIEAARRNFEEAKGTRTRESPPAGAGIRGAPEDLTSQESRRPSRK